MGKRVRGAGMWFGILLAAAGAAAPAARAETLLGVGVHSWRTVSDVRREGFGNIQRSGLSYLLSYQVHPLPLLRFELDGEYFPKGFGGSTHSAVSPQAFVLVGGFVYGGVGVGTIYSSSFSNHFSQPFYIARAGLSIHPLPRIHLDVNGNYEFHAFNQLRGVNTGTVTLGAMVRFGL
jgi:hypothetical protein